MANYTLYGNGIDDDTPAIQELLDSRVSEVTLPATNACYLISQTLKIHAGQTLRLAPTTRIMLQDNANCCMLEDDDFYTYKENICIDGGIWDMNNTKQAANPWHFPDQHGKTAYDYCREIGHNAATSGAFPTVYSGFAMRFCRVKNFTMKNVTLKNPVTYGVAIAYAENFTFRDIIFDFKTGAPKKWNMDGIHVEGYCKNGRITNLQGECHDDTVAITADDGLYGPIENITVDGIYANNSHSAVRLLSHGLPVKNIHITNIYGTFYTYCVGLTKYHGGEDERGVMQNITIDNVYAGCDVGTADVSGGRFPFLWVEKGLDVDGLTLSHVYREESHFPTPTVKVDRGATVHRLVMEDIRLCNHLEEDLQPIQLDGDIHNA